MVDNKVDDMMDNMVDDMVDMVDNKVDYMVDMVDNKGDNMVDIVKALMRSKHLAGGSESITRPLFSKSWTPRDRWEGDQGH